MHAAQDIDVRVPSLPSLSMEHRTMGRDNGEKLATAGRALRCALQHQEARKVRLHQ